ncbi:hypothetical protein J537_2334 [Acinetobacter baumannii 1437282]|nr:hypothetical protein J537_2334 [Acinetobacter baumannii 1437282]
MNACVSLMLEGCLVLYQSQIVERYSLQLFDLHRSKRATQKNH